MVCSHLDRRSADDPLAQTSALYSLQSPPIIAPIWNNININTGGRLYYRLESDPVVAEQVGQEISSQFSEAESFHPSLVFVATWDGVTPVAFTSDLGGYFIAFQVVVASNGS